MKTDTKLQTWVIPLPWSKPPLSLNDRLHFRAEAALIATVKHQTRSAVIAAGIPRLEHAVVTLTWTVPDKRVRDEENPVATLKACCDALKDENYRGIRLLGIVPDDDPSWMTKHMPVIKYIRGCKALTLTISGRVCEATG